MTRYKIGRCVKCGGETRIRNVRENRDGAVMRTRECGECGHAFVTAERPLGVHKQAVCGRDLLILLQELGIPIDDDR